EVQPPLGGQAELPTVRYRIQENRILKSGELRYYDHPKFGLLAAVIRIEEEDEDLDDSGELLGYGPE
ncbi:MAG: CsiV family protein, partial [Woeseiaceae bacterium]